MPVAWLLALMAAAEVLDLLRRGGHRPAASIVYVGVSLVFLAGCAPAIYRLLGISGPAGSPGWTLAALTVALGLAFVAEMLRFKEPGGAILNVAMSLFVIVYTGLLMNFLAQLRFFHSNQWGMAALTSLIFVAKMSDTGAYAFGRLLGRRKMTPLLSPGKTVEGAIGGLASAAVSSWLFFQLVVPLIAPEIGPRAPWWGCWVYGLAVGAAGMVGDLAVSLLKRDMRRKDSSRWLPGLGGVLDILDSILMAAPAALMCWVAHLVGPGQGP
jgi:phosphatidate cytidylyltransferase